MDKKESIFYCPFDGKKLIEKNLGFLFCKECSRYFLPSWKNDIQFNLQVICKEDENDHI